MKFETLDKALMSDKFVNDLNSLNLQDCWDMLTVDSHEEFRTFLEEEGINILNYATRLCRFMVPKNVKSVTIPKNIKSIDRLAFYYRTSLQSIDIPDSVTSIGEDAFSGCYSLANVEIPNSVTNIGNYAFHACESLTSVLIPDSVTSIGNYAFDYCRSLTTIKIPNSITRIGEYAFSRCSKLTSIKIPDSVSIIGYRAFSDCKSLESVTIPNSVTLIDQDAFSSCYSLTSINYLGTKKEAIKLSIGNRSRKTWRQDSPIQKIICTDGIINLNEVQENINANNIMKFTLVERLLDEQDNYLLIEATVRGETALRQCLCDLLLKFCNVNLNHTEYSLHHKDKDHFNNEIENLILVKNNMNDPYTGKALKNAHISMHNKIKDLDIKNQPIDYEDYMDAYECIDVWKSIQLGRLVTPKGFII